MSLFTGRSWPQLGEHIVLLILSIFMGFVTVFFTTVRMRADRKNNVESDPLLVAAHWISIIYSALAITTVLGSAIMNHLAQLN